jgi:hypothetical protein
VVKLKPALRFDVADWQGIRTGVKAKEVSRGARALR